MYLMSIESVPVCGTATKPWKRAERGYPQECRGDSNPQQHHCEVLVLPHHEGRMMEARYEAPPRCCEAQGGQTEQHTENPADSGAAIAAGWQLFQPALHEATPHVRSGGRQAGGKLEKHLKVSPIKRILPTLNISSKSCLPCTLSETHMYMPQLPQHFEALVTLVV